MVDFGTPTELDTDLGSAIFDLIEELGKTAAITIVDDQDSIGLDPTAPEGSRILNGASTEYEIKVTPPFPATQAFLPVTTLKEGSMVFYLSAYQRTFNLVAGSLIELPAIPRNEFWETIESARIWSGEQQVLWQIVASKRV